MIRASSTSRSLTVKSLRSTGREHAARAACRSATEPPKCGSSVNTERQLAPPSSYALATDPGSRPTNRSPLDGDLRLISAITARPASARSAAANPRAGGSDAASDINESIERRSDAATERWWSRIASRYVVTVAACSEAEPGSNLADQRVDGNAYLFRRVAVANRDRIVLQRIEVDGDAQRRSHFVLTPVAPPDRLRLVVVDHVVLAQ